MIDIKPTEYYEIEALTWRQPSLDTIASEFYGQQYSTLDGLYDNFKNDMHLTFDTSQNWADVSEMEEWIEDGGDSPHPSTVLQDLAEKGVIPKGKYLLSISW